MSEGDQKTGSRWKNDQIKVCVSIHVRVADGVIITLLHVVHHITCSSCRSVLTALTHVHTQTTHTHLSHSSYTRITMCTLCHRRATGTSVRLSVCLIVLFRVTSLLTILAQFQASDHQEPVLNLPFTDLIYTAFLFYVCKDCH